MAACKSKDNACVLTMVDNYVHLQWPKHFVANRAFTVQCPTVQVIVAFMDKEDPNAGVENPQPLPCIAAPWDWTEIGAVMVGDGVVVPAHLREI
jgi:hypothetical protein